mmetsp:Transcript_3694/g.7526  ORF Transcript_3694/g.7526 Transcript_3694/m.7526 type:complete len:127 (+) Transcript_3694:543-923(+)
MGGGVFLTLLLFGWEEEAAEARRVEPDDDDDDDDDDGNEKSRLSGSSAPRNNPKATAVAAPTEDAESATPFFLHSTRAVASPAAISSEEGRAPPAHVRVAKAMEQPAEAKQKAHVAWRTPRMRETR